LSPSAAGASVAIRVNGELLPDNGDLPSAAIVPIYSITKTLTAICALKLAESRLLRLEDPIGAIVTDVDLPRAITLTHLLRHTSGLRDYGGQRQYHEAVRSHPSHPWTREQFVDAVVPKGLLFEPGTGWSYSNVGYMLIVDAIERATGHPFATVLDHIVAAPLGLRNTFTLEQPSDMQLCVAGFGTDVTIDGSMRDVRDVYHPGWCAPRLVASTAAETTRIYDALFTGELLESRMLDRMLALVPMPGTSGAPPSIGAGMGVYSDAASKHGLNYHHGGGGPGYSTSVTIYPETPQGRVAIAVFLDSSEVPEARETEMEWLEKVLGWR
jgi:D-alanyl-D-alanine carboxypeptidase